jgi:hypothetical protein
VISPICGALETENEAVMSLRMRPRAAHSLRLPCLIVTEKPEGSDPDCKMARMPLALTNLPPLKAFAKRLSSRPSEARARIHDAPTAWGVPKNLLPQSQLFQVYLGHRGLVHHTDAEREWAYDRNSRIGKLDKALDEGLAKGWTIVDMKRV